jgi:hypothetical protein
MQVDASLSGHGDENSEELDTTGANMPDVGQELTVKVRTSSEIRRSDEAVIQWLAHAIKPVGNVVCLDLAL